MSEPQLADLSALADNTLDPARLDEVQASIAASPELTVLYERERRTVEILHRARAERAPLALRERLEAQRPSARARTRRRAGYGGALAAGLAVIALALVLILPSGTPGAPSVSQAASLALRGAVAPAPTPAADPDAPNATLLQNVGDVYFPNWAGKFGWKAIGQRVDRINGRTAVTVYYQRGSAKVAYTIVSAPALDAPEAPVSTLNNVELRTLTVSQRKVVTWQRDNHTCVLSSNPEVPASVLQKLAAWSGESA